jgi:hypothetical protein
MAVGFNGEVLVGRGDAFVEALTQFWDWDEEVTDDWPLRDGWRAVCVRTPAEDGELAELADVAGAPVLACLVFESDLGHVQGISAAGHWEARLNTDSAARLGVGGEWQANRPDTVRAVVEWADQADLLVDAAQIADVLSMPWTPQAQRGFFALLAVLGIADHEPAS